LRAIEPDPRLANFLRDTISSSSLEIDQSAFEEAVLAEASRSGPARNRKNFLMCHNRSGWLIAAGWIAADFSNMASVCCNFETEWLSNSTNSGRDWRIGSRSFEYNPRRSPDVIAVSVTSSVCIPVRRDSVPNESPGPSLTTLSCSRESIKQSNAVRIALSISLRTNGSSSSFLRYETGRGDSLKCTGHWGNHPKNAHPNITKPGTRRIDLAEGVSSRAAKG
jgi:hypothetical protein